MCLYRLLYATVIGFFIRNIFSILDTCSLLKKDNCTRTLYLYINKHKYSYIYLFLIPVCVVNCCVIVVKIFAVDEVLQDVIEHDSGESTVVKYGRVA